MYESHLAEVTDCNPFATHPQYISVDGLEFCFGSGWPRGSGGVETTLDPGEYTVRMVTDNPVRTLLELVNQDNLLKTASVRPG